MKNLHAWWNIKAVDDCVYTLIEKSVILAKLVVLGYVLTRQREATFCGLGYRRDECDVTSLC
jgi:hypothetical protein